MQRCSVLNITTPSLRLLKTFKFNVFFRTIKDFILYDTSRSVCARHILSITVALKLEPNFFLHFFSVRTGQDFEPPPIFHLHHGECLAAGAARAHFAALSSATLNHT